MDTVISINNLTKKYGGFTAVDNLSLDIQKGEIFGIIGHNGAGKTTALECIEGFRTPTSGTISVLGLHPEKDQRTLKHRIGIQHQHSELPERIKVREALALFSAMYNQHTDLDTLLEQLDLVEKQNSYFGKLSGGQKQRLFIALALLHQPEIVFLDELTTGLDPVARREIWKLLESIRDAGTTIVLTTHFMDEAERLCDRIAFLQKGKLIALDTPEKLQETYQQSTLEDVFLYLTEQGEMA